jgi:hypothetical protein
MDTYIPYASLLMGILSAIVAFTAKNPLDRAEMIAGAFFFIGGAAICVPEMLPRSWRRTRSAVENIALLSFFGGMVVILGTLVSGPRALSIYEFVYRGLHRLVGPYMTTLLCTAVLASAGYGLFSLKTKRLMIYANAEITFALTSCYVAVERSRESFSAGTVTVLAGATYLVVRGLENRQKAIDAKGVERKVIPLPVS